MKIKFPKLLDNDKETKKLRLKRLSKDLKDIKEVLYYQGFPFVLKVIYLKLISRHYDNLFAGHLGMKKHKS